MKIIGMMLARNEDWIIGYSARVALRWCDQLVVMLHNTTDRSEEILSELDPKRVIVLHRKTEEFDEMDLRQQMFKAARNLPYASHFAIIDADEVLSSNLTASIRQHIRRLEPGELLELPMLPAYGKTDIRHDASIWCSSWLTVAFRDKGDLCWKDRNGYHHHNRPPKGSHRSKRSHLELPGGVFHYQWADDDRLTAKHVWYRMQELLRWPERETPAQLNKKYDQALIPPDAYMSIPYPWVVGYCELIADYLHIGRKSWYVAEIEKMLENHGRDKFLGLDLKDWNA